MKKFQLAAPGPLRDRLIQAVLDGKKTATSSLLSGWLEENEGLPKLGEQQAPVDSANNTVAVIEITSIDQYRLAEVDELVARDEGEDFSDVAEWRKAHEDFWKPKTVDDDTIVVVERFRLI